MGAVLACLGSGDTIHPRKCRATDFFKAATSDPAAHSFAQKEPAALGSILGCSSAASRQGRQKAATPSPPQITLLNRQRSVQGQMRARSGHSKSRGGRTDCRVAVVGWRSSSEVLSRKVPMPRIHRRPKNPQHTEHNNMVKPMRRAAPMLMVVMNTARWSAFSSIRQHQCR